MMPAAPSPWTPRAAASIGKEVAMKQATDAAVNTTTPAR